MSCRDYMKLRNDHRSFVNESSSRSLPFKDHDPLELTWSLSLYQLQKKDWMAQFYLSVWAALDSQDVWFELIENANHFPSRGAEVGNRASFHGAMKLLCEYGFAEIGPVVGEVTHECIHGWMTRIILAGDFRADILIFAFVLVNMHSARSSVRKIAVNHRLLSHASHLLRISTSTLVPVKDGYLVAQQLFRLSGIFLLNRSWLSSPTLTVWLDIFQINHPITPNLLRQEQCHRGVIALCKDMEGKEFKDLHRDTLQLLSDVTEVRGTCNNIRIKWLENRSCRILSHPNQYICPRCFQNLHVHIIPYPLILFLILSFVCDFGPFTQIQDPDRPPDLDFALAAQPHSSLCRCPALEAPLQSLRAEPNIDDRRPVLNWYIRGPNRTWIVHAMTIFWNCPQFYAIERFGTFYLSAHPLHIGPEVSQILWFFIVVLVFGNAFWIFALTEVPLN
jgi:hypothetical protein